MREKTAPIGKKKKNPIQVPGEKRGKAQNRSAPWPGENIPESGKSVAKQEKEDSFRNADRGGGDR